MTRSPRLPEDSTIGQRLRMLRTANRMSSRDLAAKAGISASQLSRIEHDRQDPNWSTVERICCALGVRLKEEVIEHEVA